MRKRVSMLIGLVVVILSGLFFTACGGGGGGTQTGSVSLFFTDSPADDYSSVLVKVYEVNLCSDNQCQNKVNLFTNQQGLEVDLSKLNGILQYINTANIPQGTYNRLEVILDKNLTIIDDSGESRSAIFTPMQEKPNKPNTVQCASNKCYIRFNGTVQPFAMGKLVVDFVLKEFEVDESASPWQVKEVKMMPSIPPTNKYKVYLSVQSVNSQNNTITGTWMGKTYTVNISSNTVCEINDNYYQGNNCTGQIQSGMCIEVKTYQDPSNLTTFTATKIEMEKPDKCANSSGPSPNPNYKKLKGIVSSKNDQDSTFNINTHGNPIKVTSSTYCEYQEDVYVTGTQCFTNLQTYWLVKVKIDSTNEAIKIEKE